MRMSLSAAVAVVFATSVASAQQGSSLKCAGSEPFWGLTITATAMWFTDHDDKRSDLVLVKPRNATGKLPDLLRVYETRRAKDGRTVTLVVRRNYDNCIDSMLEGNFAYDGVYMTPEGVYLGCCSWAK